MFAIASLFAILGGFLDAYSYLARGHVFASNLRNAVSGWVQLALGETDPKLRGEAIIGSVILLCFAAGTLLGGVSTLHLPAYPLLPGVVLAAAGTMLTMRERKRRLN
ncbi:MAG: hypothetical protein ACLPZF_13940 [Candidatus Acidiferrales bacterium]